MTEAKGLLEQHQELAEADRDRAAQRYWELLVRADQPEPDDATGLEWILKALGRVPADVANDIELAKSIVRLQPIADPGEIETRRAAVQAASREFAATEREITAERERLEKRLLEARDDYARLEGQLKQSAEAARSLKNYEDRWRAEVVEGTSLEAYRAGRRDPTPNHCAPRGACVVAS